MKVFNLPDLGEGLPDAEIVRWLVKEGDQVELDQPMVEMETAKAVVEVPSPFNGKVTKLCGNAGDIIEVGSVLVEFDGSLGSSSKQSNQASGDVHSKEAAVTQENPVIKDTNSVLDIFTLPDLGEGLPDAEIVRWLVKQGDQVKLDQPMVEMETAKAVVEVPAPVSATIAKLYGQAGDIIEVGKPLVSFGEAISDYSIKASAETSQSPSSGAATVVGAMQASDEVVVESADAVVKALARKLKVDLNLVVGSGKKGQITQVDVKQAKLDGKLLSQNHSELKSQPVLKSPNENPLKYRASPAVRAHAYRLGVSLSTCIATGKKQTVTKADVARAVSSGGLALASSTNSKSANIKKPLKLEKSSLLRSHEPQRVRGVRLAMAMGMANSHATVVSTTLMEDADITSWPKQDSLARYVRALVYASSIEPALNCWFDAEKSERIVHPEVHLGLAIDSPDGLYVPVIHHADQKNASQIRARVEELRHKVSSKSLKPDDQQGATLTLSNFGSITGRYATPVVSPPQVAILGTGRFRDELKMGENGIFKHKLLPLSLTFDHRACTGGEAARFLAAIIQDLEKPL